MAKPKPAPLGRRLVTPGELIAALGVTRSAFIRALKARRIPEAEYRVGRTRKSHRRWSIVAAAGIVRAAGRAVPEAWANN